MNANHHEGVRLAALGISVIRIERGGKRPLEPSWLPFTKVPRTIEQARRDFTPPSNIAIVTGPVSGLVGVDCDSEEAERWALNNLPASQMMVRTPGGGLHLYYRYPVGCGIRCSVKHHDLAIDVRASGGYLLCPKSCDKHGTPYQWVQGPPRTQLLRELPTFDSAWLGQ